MHNGAVEQRRPATATIMFVLLGLVVVAVVVFGFWVVFGLAESLDGLAKMN